jgi:hypothetical protein
MIMRNRPAARIKVQVAALSKRHRIDCTHYSVAGSRLYNAHQETERAFFGRPEQSSCRWVDFTNSSFRVAIPGSH